MNGRIADVAGEPFVEKSERISALCFLLYMAGVEQTVSRDGRFEGFPWWQCNASCRCGGVLDLRFNYGVLCRNIDFLKSFRGACSFLVLVNACISREHVFWQARWMKSRDPSSCFGSKNKACSKCGGRPDIEIPQSVCRLHQTLQSSHVPGSEVLVRVFTLNFLHLSD